MSESLAIDLLLYAGAVSVAGLALLIIVGAAWLSFVLLIVLIGNVQPLAATVRDGLAVRDKRRELASVGLAQSYCTHCKRSGPLRDMDPVEQVAQEESP